MKFVVFSRYFGKKRGGNRKKFPYPLLYLCRQAEIVRQISVFSIDKHYFYAVTLIKLTICLCFSVDYIAATFYNEIKFSGFAKFFHLLPS